MQVHIRWFFALMLGLLLSPASLVQAQSWKPALRDADALYDAAEDLHDRAERFRDSHTLQVTYQLEQVTADLYQLLKRNACPAEVLPVLNATGATLEEASMLVSLSCQLRADRKAQSELVNAQRSFQATMERIQCALESVLPNRAVYRAPVLQVPAPYGHQVHNHYHTAPVQGLPRVRLSGVY